MYGISYSLSLSLIYATLNLPPHYHLVCDLEKRSVLCSIFFLSSWHYDPHYSMNAIVFFSIVLYYTVVLNLHTLYNYLYLLKNFILHLSVSKNPEIHIMLYTHILKGERWFSVYICNKKWKLKNSIPIFNEVWIFRRV